ncbi:RNA polymerase II elongation factor Ell [Ooceraea biroi]|uniref:RNA polymerase II elongation factor Ell n=1 Tax=Ooceraea biroi TaxID=2015173 RepID=UPI0005BCCC17|nr:RNA polymerase II elongation factor Ell [Ooceraea biroi]
MGDEEMALVPGVQYGLSSRDKFDQNNCLIFTKLTDSSFRAIQNYVKNRHKCNDKLSIQFLGNEGKFIIPSGQGHGSAVFTFSLSSNQDMEGPQGGFECVQQIGPKSLEGLGAIPYRMRIQANDEVYETTRYRMAVAEENSKNKCTRVIKANGPDIGRKVKVKGTGRTIPPPSSSYVRGYRELTSIPAASNSQPRTSTNKPAVNSSSNNHSTTTRTPEKKISDLMRRPLKERLIHVLALRPYKKPELYDRINKEGLRERERPVMITILKQVAYMRDNTYHLHRHIWNDVQEDWPFYTEQEKAVLKRRKPQNLTPPGSSDGSGQSPNSIHAGSPPAITAPPPSLLNNKRPGYHQGNDGLPTKKPRISHYRKPEPISFVAASEKTSSVSSTGAGNYSNNNSGLNVTVGGDRTGDYTVDRSSAYGGNNNSASASGGGGNSSGATSVADVSDPRQTQQTQRERSGRLDYRVERTANSDVLRGTTGNSVAAITSTSRSSCQISSPNDNGRSSHHQSGNRRDGVATGASGAGGPSDTNADRRDRSDRSRGMREDRESRNRSSFASNAATYSSRASTSAVPATYAGSSSNITAMTSPRMEVFEMPWSPDPLVCRDYLTNYTTITSVEQKRRYKDDFIADYGDYRTLHSEVVVIAKRFKELYEEYQKQVSLGNEVEQETISKQMVYEYWKIKKDKELMQRRNRFNYLHAKLDHIKQLLAAFEVEERANQAAMRVNKDMLALAYDTPMNPDSTVNTKGIDNRYY